MGLILNTNISSIIAQNALNTNSTALSISLQRLSTGLKINSGADGPAERDQRTARSVLTGRESCRHHYKRSPESGKGTMRVVMAISPLAAWHSQR